MELDKYTSTLRVDLLAAAALGDDHTRRTADALGAAAEASARLMLLQALSDFADEVTAQLDEHTVHLRLVGTGAVADVTRAPAPHSSAPHASAAHASAAHASDDPKMGSERPEDYPTMDDVTGEMRRVTLRMVEHVKERAEEAASMNGVSLNSWLSQAVQGALREQMRKERPY